MNSNKETKARFKILQVYHLFYPAKGYGTTNYIENLSKELASRGHEIHVATTKLITPIKELKKLKRIQFKFNLKIHRFPIIRLGKLFFSFSYIKFILTNRYDLIHLHGLENFFSLIVFLLKKLNLIRCPILINTHGGIGSKEIAIHSYKSLKRVLKKFYNFILLYFVRSAHRILAVSKFEAYYIIKLGLNKEIFEILPSGVDTIKYNAVKNLAFNLEKFGINNYEVILHIGKLAKVKGIEILIKAIKKVVIENKKVRLLIVGVDYGYGKKLRQLVKDLNLNDYVTFCGRVSARTLLGLYIKAKIIVIPSEIEMFGAVSVEAGFFGKPVIATNVGALPEIIEDGYNGFLIPYGDTDILADKILILLKNHKLRYIFGKNARNKVNNYYSWENIGRKVEEIYKKLVITKN